MQSLVDALQPHVPGVSFRPGRQSSWSPDTKLISYKRQPTLVNEWGLCHEVAHAVLQHQSYAFDMELLALEVAAWELAESLAERFASAAVDADYLQDCLDTYRDWLHQRSTCPSCGGASLQSSPTAYRCHNCNTTWSVTTARFCRPYRRRSSASPQKNRPKVPQAIFMAHIRAN
jgi:hypothetical protein